MVYLEKRLEPSNQIIFLPTKAETKLVQKRYGFSPRLGYLPI